MIELCPVGALTSSMYRFDARPWEIQNVPTVCTGLRHRLQHDRDDPRGQGQAHPLPQPRRDRPRLALRQGSLHVPAPARARPHHAPLQRGPKGLKEISWDEALDAAEEMLREAEGGIVTALSGAETTEIAYALGRLLRAGVGAHSAVLPEATSDALEAFRLPLSGIAEAELVVVVGDDPVVERAPIVDLWIKEARRRGAEIVVGSPTGTVQVAPGGSAEFCRELSEDGNALGQRLRAADRAVLVWSGPGGGGGARIAELAHELGFEDKPGCGAFHLPVTPNGRAVAAAWSASADADETKPETIGVLFVSGEDAAADPGVRALAEQAERVIVVTMFHELAGGWADLILPATGALERDGTTMNLEGRLQRLRRAVMPPCPDELAWISKLAARFDVEISPHVSAVFAELSEHLFQDLVPRRDRPASGATVEDVVRGSRACRAAGVGARRVATESFSCTATARSSPGLRSSACASSSSSAPSAEVEISAVDADAARDLVRGLGARALERNVRRAPCTRQPASGRGASPGFAEEHAADLHATVEVVKS